MIRPKLDDIACRMTDAELRACGSYSVPRPCLCGKSHLDRATYWKHRLEAEAKRG